MSNLEIAMLCWGIIGIIGRSLLAYTDPCVKEYGLTVGDIVVILIGGTFLGAIVFIGAINNLNVLGKIWDMKIIKGKQDEH